MKKFFAIALALSVFIAPNIVGAQSPGFEDQLTCHQFTVALGLGSRGRDVEMLQRYLVARGLLSSGLPYGYFGTLTEQAVKTLQGQNGLEPVGSVGPLTRALLNRCNSDINLGGNSGPTNSITLTANGSSYVSVAGREGAPAPEVILEWNAPGATSCTASSLGTAQSAGQLAPYGLVGWGGLKAASGSQKISIYTSARFVLECNNRYRTEVTVMYEGYTTDGTIDNTNINTPITNTRPATPTNIRATAVSGTQVSITWDPVPGATHYTIGRSSGTTVTATAYIGRSNTNTYVDTTAIPGNTYTYAASSWKDALYSVTSARSAPVTTPATQTPPTAAIAGRTDSSCGGGLTISWPPLSNGSWPYKTKVYRDNLLVWTAGYGNIDFHDLVSPGSTHSYYVIAMDEINSGSKSNTISVTGSSSCTNPPPPPPPTTTTASTITLTATPSTVNYGEPVSLRVSLPSQAGTIAPSYCLWPDGHRSTTFPASFTYYPGKTIVYEVKCYDSSNTVRASASAAVTVNAPAATTKPAVSLTASPSTTIKYGESVTLKLSSTGADYCAAIVTSTNQIVNPNGATSGSLTFKPTETASYGVSCYNTGGKPISQWPVGTPASITITVTPVTSDSTGPTLSSDSSGNLSWNPVRNSAGQAATLYGVGITRPGNSEVEYFTTSTSYTPTGEGPGATIKFRVRAVSPFTSPWSNQVSVTIPETTSSNATQLQMIANTITALQQLLNSFSR